MANFTIKYIYQLVDKLSPSMKNMARAGAGLTKSLHGTGKAADKAHVKLNRLARTMRSMRTMKMGLGGMFAGLGSGILMRQVGSTIIDYDKAMRMVEANMMSHLDESGATVLKRLKTAKESTAMLNALDEEVSRVAQASIFDPTEVAGGLLELARAGVDAKDSLAMLHPVMRLAGAAGNITPKDATDIATNITMAFGKDLDKTIDTVDVLAAAASDANTDIKQLGEAMKMAAPSAFTAGRGLKEVTGTLMVFASRGFKGGMAGVTLARMIDSIYKRTGPAVKALKGIGLSHSDFMGEDGNTIPITEMLNKFKAAAENENIGREKVIMAINTMMGARGGRGGKLLMDQADAIKAKIRWLELAENRAALMERVMMSGIYGAYERMRAAFADSIIDLGKGGLADDMSYLAGKIKDLAAAFTELSPATKKWIGRALLFVAAISMAIIPLGIFAWAIMALVPLFSLLLSPIALVIAGVLLLIATLYELYQNWDGSALQAFFIGLADVAADAWQSIKDSMFGALQGALDLATQIADILFNKIPNFIFDPVGGAKKLADWAPKAVEGVGERSLSIGNSAIDQATMFYSWLKSKVSDPPVNSNSLTKSEADKQISLGVKTDTNVTVTAPQSITLKGVDGRVHGSIQLGAQSDKGRTQVESAANVGP